MQFFRKLGQSALAVVIASCVVVLFCQPAVAHNDKNQSSVNETSDTWGMMSLNGQVAVNYVHRGSDANDTTTLSGASFEEILLHVEGPVSKDVYFFSEFEIVPNAGDDELGSAHDQTLTVDRAFLKSREWVNNHTTKAGVFYLFDGMIQQYHHSHANPLPGEIVFFKNPWAHHDTLHDVLSDLGVKVAGRQGNLHYSVALFNGMGDITTESTRFANASMDGYYGNVRYRIPGMKGTYFGLSYYRSEATADTEWGGDRDEYAVAEAAYRADDWRLRGLYLTGTQTRGKDTDGDGMDEEFDNEGSGYVVEGLYDVTDFLSGVARYQAINVDDPDNMSFFGIGEHHGIGEVEQIEAGLNYHLSEHTRLKGSWQVNDESAENTEADRGIIQLTASF